MLSHVRHHGSLACRSGDFSCDSLKGMWFKKRLFKLSENKADIGKCIWCFFAPVKHLWDRAIDGISSWATWVKQKSFGRHQICLWVSVLPLALQWTLPFSVSHPSPVRQGSQYLAPWASKTNYMEGIKQCTCTCQVLFLGLREPQRNVNFHYLSLW